MLKTICALALAFAMPVFANELDQERTTASPQQVELSKDLPQTVIVRVSKTDPNHVEVVQLKDKVAAGQHIENLKFSKVAANAENSGLPVVASNELDSTSSTSSWSFGFYGPRGGGVYARGGYRGYGYGYGRPGYGYGYGYGGYAGYNPYYSSYYYPTYSYGGYAYPYTPYYTYSDPYWNYAYCATTISYWY